MSKFPIVNKLYIKLFIPITTNEYEVSFGGDGNIEIL